MINFFFFFPNFSKHESSNEAFVRIIFPSWLEAKVTGSFPCTSPMWPSKNYKGIKLTWSLLSLSALLECTNTHQQEHGHLLSARTRVKLSFFVSTYFEKHFRLSLLKQSLCVLNKLSASVLGQSKRHK